MTILAVTGLRREAKIIARARDVITVTGGGDAKALAKKLDSLHGDITGVISIGIAGALSPLLKAGDVVMADWIIAQAQSWRCHQGWRVALAARLPDAHCGPIAGSDTILADTDAKTALHNQSGALAADMESHVAARFAAARALPLAALRVISDDVRHVLPPAALVAMTPDGGIAMGKIIGSLLRHPLQVPSLISTARTSNKAFAELLRCLDLCGAGLAGLDL